MIAENRVLILMAGMPGSGKSTIAHQLGRELGLAVIDKDVILTALLEASVPEASAQPGSYRAMFAIAASLLHQQLSVVVDSPAAFPETVRIARKICDQTSARLVAVLCSAEQDVRNERVARRRSLRSQPAGVSTTSGTARERFTHLPGDTIEIDTMAPLDVAVREAVETIRVRIAPDRGLG